MKKIFYIKPIDIVGIVLYDVNHQMKGDMTK